MMVENSEANRERCSCPGCPSSNSCMRTGNEALYCAVGKSGCAVERLGCVCASCVVYRQNELSSLYFCVSGIAAR
jgi:aldose sugar dehydrogenase